MQEGGGGGGGGGEGKGGSSERRIGRKKKARKALLWGNKSTHLLARLEFLVARFQIFALVAGA